MWVLGLTGGIGSGKSTVTEGFSKLGIDIIDSDIISREVVEPGSSALTLIRQRFGEHITLADGHLNRDALRKIVFDSAEDLNWLQSVTHPAIRKRTEELIQNASSHYAILASPLLLESKQYTLTNRICVVDIPEEEQLYRSTLRDNTSAEAIRKIMNKQMPREERLSQADDIIDNSKSIEHTFAQIKNLHRKYLNLAKKHELSCP